MVEHEGDSVYRRGALIAAGGLAAGLAGCQGILGTGDSDGTDEQNPDGGSGEPDDGGANDGNGEEDGVRFGFEVGDYEPVFEDASQDAVEPAVSDEYAYAGDRALFLSSHPGTSTNNRVRTTTTWTGAHEYRVAVKPVRIDGPELSIAVDLRHADSDRRLHVFSSPFHGGTRIEEFGESEDAALSEERVASVLEPGDWTEVAITVEGEAVTVSVGSQSLEVRPEWDVASAPVEVTLHANGWGSGHRVEAAFDEFAVEPL